VVLTPADRELLQRCLRHEPGAWNDFVDRFLGLIYHVIHHTAYLRSVPLRPQDVEDLAAEILLRLVDNDYAALRQFRGRASLAAYLTVIARRICVQELARRQAAREVQLQSGQTAEPEEPPRAQVGLETLEEVARLLRRLPAKERAVVRLHYLEGRSYEEISTQLNIPLNSIGPILARARQRLRQSAAARGTRSKAAEAAAPPSSASRSAASGERPARPPGETPAKTAPEAATSAKEPPAAGETPPGKASTGARPASPSDSTPPQRESSPPASESQPSPPPPPSPTTPAGNSSGE
jgi:RNA polymerase sigma-70 factor (ECF subfamily)